MVDRKLNDTTYAPYADFIWALHDNADLRIPPHDTASSGDKVSFVDVLDSFRLSLQKEGFTYCHKRLLYKQEVEV